MADSPSSKTLLESLSAGAPALRQKDFLLTWDHSVQAINAVLDTATLLQRAYAAGRPTQLFHTGLALSIFRDKSTRTRFAYASAASLLGLSCQDLDETKTQVAHGETVRETANMISFLTEVIGIRDDLYIHEGHKYMCEVADAVEEGRREGVLDQRPAVINLQCDLDHPTQTLADLLHLSREFGSLEALRGKKIAMTWAYSPSYGKPLSVPQGIIGLMTRFGMDVVLAHPEGYDLLPETIAVAQQNAAHSGGSFAQTHSMADAFANADIVYPKSWTPFHIAEERTRLLRQGASDQLKELEQTGLAENAKHRDWECTDALIQKTRQGRALYMHCLPADITGVSCEHGEVSAEIFERYRIKTYREASHKPYVIAALILLARCPDPVAFLRQVAG